MQTRKKYKMTELQKMGISAGIVMTIILIVFLATKFTIVANIVFGGIIVIVFLALTALLRLLIFSTDDDA
jgi:hypothetical protein